MKAASKAAHRQQDEQQQGTALPLLAGKGHLIAIKRRARAADPGAAPPPGAGGQIFQTLYTGCPLDKSENVFLYTRTGARARTRERIRTQKGEQMQIITTAIIKGGTGKTTTAAAIAQAAAADGKRVLCVDLDPQANFSAFIGADRNHAGSLELLTGADPAEVIQETAQGLDAITAAPDLATLTTSAGSAKRLQMALQPIKRNYDFIIIDTPPQIGELTFNALQASTGLLIPLESDNSSLQGLYQIADIAEQMKNSNKGLQIIGTLLTRYEARTKINKYLQEVIAEQSKQMGLPYLGEVRAGVAIREAQGLQLSLYEYAPKCKPAQDYAAIYKAIKGKG